jgi:hypothetical protein
VSSFVNVWVNYYTCKEHVIKTYIFLSLGGCKIVSCCNSDSGMRRSKATVNIHMFTVGAGKIQRVYCLGGMRIRLSISEMNMRIVTLQDLQTLTSESGNNFFFHFDIRWNGVFSFKPPSIYPIWRKYGSRSIRWLVWPQNMYRRFAKGIEKLLLLKIRPRILRRPARNLATVLTHMFLLWQVLLRFPNNSTCYLKYLTSCICI